MGAIIGALGAVASVASAGISAASAAGAFGGGATGPAALDYGRAQELLKQYQDMVEESTAEYQGNVAGATGGYRSAVSTSLADYMGSTVGFMDDYKKSTNKAIKQYNKRTSRQGANYVNSIDALTKDVFGTVTAPSVEKAIAFNEANTGRYGKIAQDLSLSDQDTRFKMLDRAIPQWRAERDQAARTNASLAAGELPSDVRRLVAQHSAQSALQGGFAGSGAAANLSARDLGLTSLDLINRGQAGQQNWQQHLYNIGVPQQTRGFDVMGFTGLSSQQAITGGLAGLAAQIGARGAAYNSKTAALGNILQSKLGVQNTLLNAGTRLGETVLGTSVGAEGNIYSGLLNSYGNIYGAQTHMAENIASGGAGILSNQRDDAQARANYNLAQSEAIGSSVAKGVGAAAGAYSTWKTSQQKTNQSNTSQQKTTVSKTGTSGTK